jgi:hypothetical protein
MGNLLGYIFWHRSRPGTFRGRYEKKLTAFQESLKAHRPDGLIDALSFRIKVRPWSKRRSPGYEDWYLVRDFGSLGVLNDAAVANQNKRQHDDVARDATGGAGGVYKLLSGDLPLRDARFETWMRKPPRTPYQAFLDDVSRLVGDRRTALWRRQMVLSPASEFCLQSDLRIALPRGFHAATARLNVVGAKSGGLFADDLERLGDPLSPAERR